MLAANYYFICVTCSGSDPVEDLSAVGINDTTLLISFSDPVSANGIINHYTINVEDATIRKESFTDVVAYSDDPYCYVSYANGLSEQLRVTLYNIWVRCFTFKVLH